MEISLSSLLEPGGENGTSTGPPKIAMGVWVAHQRNTFRIGRGRTLRFLQSGFTVVGMFFGLYSCLGLFIFSGGGGGGGALKTRCLLHAHTQNCKADCMVCERCRFSSGCIEAAWRRRHDSPSIFFYGVVTMPKPGGKRDTYDMAGAFGVGVGARNGFACFCPAPVCMLPFLDFHSPFCKAIGKKNRSLRRQERARLRSGQSKEHATREQG